MGELGEETGRILFVRSIDLPLAQSPVSLGLISLFFAVSHLVGLLLPSASATVHVIFLDARSPVGAKA